MEESLASQKHMKHSRWGGGCGAKKSARKAKKRRRTAWGWSGMFLRREWVYDRAMRECERGKKWKKEVKKQLGLVFPCPWEISLEKKKSRKTKTASTAWAMEQERKQTKSYIKLDRGWSEMEQREFLGQADRHYILLEWRVNLKRESIHVCWRYVHRYADGVIWVQKCRVKSGSNKKKRGKQSFLKCMYRISPIKELAGRGVGSSWLARPYHRRMSSACMGKPPCSHSSRGEVERLCAENTSARWACFRWHGLWNHTSAWRTDRKSVNLTKSNPKSNPL